MVENNNINMHLKMNKGSVCVANATSFKSIAMVILHLSYDNRPSSSRISYTFMHPK